MGSLTNPKRARASHLLKGTSLVLMLSLLFVLAPATLGKGGTPPTEVDMANDQCGVSSSPTTCQGGFTATQTFRENVTRNEVVTVFFMYLYGNSEAVNMSFYDSLGNTPILVTSQCSTSSPIACTATGYFQVTNAGNDNIFFTEQGGSTGEIWYNAEIWQDRFTKFFSSQGSSQFCAQSCTDSLSLGPLANSSEALGVIAASAYVGYYPSTPATWQPSYYYSYSLTDSNSTGGDSILWQANTTLALSYSFAATTSPTPNSWAGSAEVIYWSQT